MSRHHQIERAEQESRRMRMRIADHKVGLNGMTVRGFPTQSATGALNKLCAEFILLERRAQLLRDRFQASISLLGNRVIPAHERLGG